MRDLTQEQWADLISFGTLVLLWSGFVVLSLKRTRRWDLPTRAITVVLFIQAVREGMGFARTVDEDLVSDQMRGIVRGAMIVAAIVTMIAVKRDKPRPPQVIA